MIQKSRRLFWAVQLLAPFLVSLFFAWLDGPYLGPDSYSYIDMSLHREPAYPFFLYLFRRMCSPDSWMYWVIAVQAFITAYANYSIIRFLVLRLKLSGRMGTILSCMMLVFSLLTRYLAKRHVLYSNSILSEALAIPLFILFIRYLTGFLYRECFEEKKRPFPGKDFICSCLLCVILMSIRKQMIFVIALLLAASVFVWLAKKRPVIVLQTFLSVMVIYALTAGIDLVYNQVFHGSPMRNSSGASFLLAMVIYTAEREDADRIADEEVKDLFLQIYDDCAAAECLKANAEDGRLNGADHFAAHYNHIQVDRLRPIVSSYVEQNYPGTAVDQNVKSGEIMSEMTTALLPACLPSMIDSFLDNFLFGLVTTVTKTTPLLIAAAAVLYAGYLFLLLRLALLRSNPRLLIFSSIVLLSILVNVAVVSAVIFCQSRYTIYNMALFYVCGLLMLSDAVSGMAGHRRGERKASSETAV